MLLSRADHGSIGRVLRTRAADVVTTLHALTVIAAVELLIRWVPLPRLSRLLGIRFDLSPTVLAERQPGVVQLPPRLSRRVCCANRVASSWPFGRGPCLRRSLVVGHLLRHRDPVIRLGVTGTDSDLVAHAWVEIDDVPLEDVIGLQVFQLPPSEVSL